METILADDIPQYEFSAQEERMQQQSRNGRLHQIVLHVLSVIRST
jgi:hypothetical protein